MRSEVTNRPECRNCGKTMQLGTRHGGTQGFMCRSHQTGFCSSVTVYADGTMSTGRKDGPRRFTNEAWVSSPHPQTEIPASAKPSAPRATPLPPAIYRRDISDAKVLVVTCAQNATPVHQQFWGCLQAIASHRGAEILVTASRYRNPTSIWSGNQESDEWWAAEVTPYLWNVRTELNKNLTLVGDAKVAITAPNPTSGMDSLTHGSSGIVGAGRIELRCVAAPSSKTPKIMVTTGAVTTPNYTDTRSGVIGEHHHQLSALVVELAEGDKFFLRHVSFDSDTLSVTDLGTRYFPDGTNEPAPRPLALIMGDTHVGSIDPKVEYATFGWQTGIVDTLDPEHLVWHDLLDGYSVNPHHAGKPFIALAKHEAGRSDIKAEVHAACDYVTERSYPEIQSVIVTSNHDRFLSRWVETADWKTDPENARFYLECAMAMANGTVMGPGGAEYPDPFQIVLEQRCDKEKVKVLRSGESFVLGNVELSMHGDKGANGSRGSLKGLSKVGKKSVIGHSHTPGIYGGAYQTGTSTYLNLEYNSGPSSWMQAHCLLLADGKRQLLFIVDGKWRA